MHSATMNTSSTAPTLVTDELSVLSSMVPLADQHIIELGCGSARLARQLLERYPGSQVTGLETDTRQHAKNLAAPQERLTFMLAGAQDIPLADAAFDLALMLKSLHHVPIPLMRQALAEVARVLRNGGHLYVSEPVYAGPLNEIVRVFNDEGPVRLAAQQAVRIGHGDGGETAGGIVEIGVEGHGHSVAVAGGGVRDERAARSLSGAVMRSK
mgnify:CR=1 FL=1